MNKTIYDSFKHVGYFINVLIISLKALNFNYTDVHTNHYTG